MKKNLTESVIKFLPQNIEVISDPTKSVLETALNHNINLDHSCGGMGSCGTCRVLIESDLDELPTRNKTEQDMADDRGFKPKERLACQLVSKKSLILKIP